MFTILHGDKCYEVAFHGDGYSSVVINEVYDDGRTVHLADLNAFGKWWPCKTHAFEALRSVIDKPTRSMRKVKTQPNLKLFDAERKEEYELRQARRNQQQRKRR